MMRERRPVQLGLLAQAADRQPSGANGTLHGCGVAQPDDDARQAWLPVGAEAVLRASAP